MSEESVQSVINIENTSYNNLDLAEEVTDDESVTNFQSETATCSYDSVLTVTPFNDNINRRNIDMYVSEEFSSKNIKVPIIGYETMEERARFTVYKLRIENTLNGNSWIVYRRYTDFVRLCTGLKSLRPDIAALLPRKRWFGNNFDTEFLNERIKGLQLFINAILAVDDLLTNTHVQDFLCLNESPLDTEKFLEDSRAMCDALSETIYYLRNQLREKDMKIVELNERLCSQELVVSTCIDYFKNTTSKCSLCLQEFSKTQLTQLISDTLNQSEKNDNICDKK